MTNGPALRKRADYQNFPEYDLGANPSARALSYQLTTRSWDSYGDLTQVLECDESALHWLTSASAFTVVSPDGVQVPLPDVALPRAAQELRRAFLRLLSAISAGAVPPSRQTAEVFDLPRSSDGKVNMEKVSLFDSHLDGYSNAITQNSIGIPAKRIRALELDGLRMTVEDFAAVCDTTPAVIEQWLTAPATDLPWANTDLVFARFCRALRLAYEGLPVITMREPKPVLATEAY